MIIWPTPKPAVKAAIAIIAEAFGEYAAVSAVMPKKLPPRFVRISRIGGGQSNPVTDDARLLVECWAQDPGAVESMTGTSRAALRNAAGTVVELRTNGVVDDWVFVRCWDKEDGPAEYSNPAYIDWIRWQFTGELSVSTTTARPGS